MSVLTSTTSVVDGSSRVDDVTAVSGSGETTVRVTSWTQPVAVTTIGITGETSTAGTGIIYGAIA